MPFFVDWWRYCHLLKLHNLKWCVKHVARYLTRDPSMPQTGGMIKKPPDWIVSSVVDLDEGKSRWREVGVGFWNEKTDTVTIKLDAVPLSGKLVMSKPKSRTPEAEADPPF